MLKKLLFQLAIIGITMVSCSSYMAQKSYEGASWVDSHGYTNCVELSNGFMSVILDPNCGGRVLEYSLDGQNAIYTSPEHDGYTYTPGDKRIDPSGGRCDIGPEMLAPGRPDLWVGRWSAEIIGPRTARLTSVKDKSSGVQLVREFRLDRDSSHLKFTQTIINISDETKR
ncbi:MAG: hypothetical protein HOC71_03850, partial [Candidatus Latescibacteria bacterium]|nr:hypothetical protein [Candidatus Latescibacterota bacterium]